MADIVPVGNLNNDIDCIPPPTAGGGTVTSVAFTADAGYTVTGSPITTSGTINLADPLTTKGDIMTHSGSATAREAVGTDGQIPVADSAQTNGWQWKTVSTGIAPILSGFLPRIRWRLCLGINGGAENSFPASYWQRSGSITSQPNDWTTAWLSIGKSLIVSSASAGSSVEYWGNSTSDFALSSTTSYVGGFLFCARVGIHTHQSTSRSFFGFTTSTSQITNADPSSMTNVVGFGNDSADANLQFMHNDASGTCTKNDLGSNFPAQTSQADFYEMIISAAPGQTGTISYWIRELISNVTASGSVTTNLPASNTGLVPHCWVNNGSTAAVVRLGMTSIWCQADW